MKTSFEQFRHPMMKCGHAANAQKLDGTPVCVICTGIASGWDEIDPNPPALSERKAKCCYCKSERPSATGLPFFEHTPNKETDNFYCGCRGWD